MDPYRVHRPQVKNPWFKVFVIQHHVGKTDVREVRGSTLFVLKPDHGMFRSERHWCFETHKSQSPVFPCTYCTSFTYSKKLFAHVCFLLPCSKLLYAPALSASCRLLCLCHQQALCGLMRYLGLGKCRKKSFIEDHFQDTLLRIGRFSGAINIWRAIACFAKMINPRPGWSSSRT